MARLTVKDVKRELEQWRGNMAAVGRALGVTRQGVWDYVQKHEALKEVQKELRETFVDNIESGLYSAAIAGNVTAQIFILKTLGKDRGYVERQEVTGKEGGPVEHILQGQIDKVYGGDGK
jgi:uncharacterized protein YabN with tetrapyrrole methylase and pyrophosphatase domain